MIGTGTIKAEVWMDAGKIYKVTLAADADKQLLRGGASDSSGDVEKQLLRFDRNLNTGGKNHDESKAVVGHNAVHH